MKRIAVAAVLLAVVGLTVLAIPTFAQGPTGGYPWGGMMGGRGGMMGGFAQGQAITPTVPLGYERGGMMGGFAPSQGFTSTAPFGYGRGGMMGGRGGMMGGFGLGQAFTSTVPFGYGRGGMMGGYGLGTTPNAKPISMDEAVTRAQQYVAAYNNPDLRLAELEEYTGNYYGLVQEKSTGTGAFQVLVNKFSGAVYPEMGPNMMWNTKYSPMASMMGRFGPSQPSGKMTVTVEQARANAAQFLKANLPNTTVENEPDTFYGYYNFDVLQNGKTYGMLSVNGYTGAVWFHSWHGDFVAKKGL